MLRSGWSIADAQVEHVPLGFGSHHWTAEARGTRWFVTVDDVAARADAGRGLLRALVAARALRDAGLDFVIAPELTVAGAVTHPVDERYVAALYPFVDGEVGSAATPHHMRSVLDCALRSIATTSSASAWPHGPTATCSRTANRTRRTPSSRRAVLC